MTQAPIMHWRLFNGDLTGENCALLKPAHCSLSQLRCIWCGFVLLAKLTWAHCIAEACVWGAWAYPMKHSFVISNYQRHQMFTPDLLLSLWSLIVQTILLALFSNSRLCRTTYATWMGECSNQDCVPKCVHAWLVTGWGRFCVAGAHNCSESLKTGANRTIANAFWWCLMLCAGTQ